MTHNPWVQDLPDLTHLFADAGEAVSIVIDADAVTAELGVGAAGAVIGPVGAVDPVEVGCTETTANWM